MKLTVHQPNFLPYMGLFDKVRQVDVFVILDDVQYTKRGFTNRNRIKKPDEQMWLTVPVVSERTSLVNEVTISTNVDWKDRHLKTLKHMYSKSDYFNEVFPPLEKVYSKEYTHLFEFNIDLLRCCFDILDIQTDMRLSSSLDLGDRMGGERIIEICKKAGCSEYFSGKSGQDYLDISAFEKEGLTVSFQNFEHPVYPQQFGEFIPNLSIVDYLFNVGGKAFW